MNAKWPSSNVTKLLAAAAGLVLLGTFGIELLAVGLMLGVAYAAYSYLPLAGLATGQRRRSGVNTQLVMLGVGALAVLAAALVIAAVPGPAQPAGLDRSGARADSHYMGVEYCKKCHGPDGTGGDQYTGWKATAHGTDFSNRSVHGEGLNLFTQPNGSCQPCHVVGYNYVGMGGFDPSQPWDSGNNSKLLGVQCEDCHGPGSDLCEECHGPPIDHSHEATNMVENPTPEQSCNGGFANSGCHGPGGRDVYTSWSSSLHSPNDQRKAASPAGLNTYCARCKSPAQYDPNAKLSNATVISKEAWRGISCADCHDSHGNRYEGQLKAPADELCSGCHNSEHAAAVPGTAPLRSQKEMFLGILGANVTGTRGMPGVQCADCHMWTTPSPVSGVNLSDYTGYPKSSGHAMTPTAEACEACHSTLGNDMPAFEMPSNAVGVNATNWTIWDTFLAKYKKEVEKRNATIEDWQGETMPLLNSTKTNVTAAKAAIDSARADRTKDAATIARATGLWGDAYWNCNLVVNDKSTGVHNHEFALDLLRDALSKSKQAIALMTENTGPVANAGPNRVASTNQDIAFDASGSYDRDGSIIGYLWDYGDGANATEMKAAHAYSDHGFYTVKLTVTDNEGARSTAFATVFINNVGPKAFAGVDRTVAPGDNVTFNGSSSDDPDGDIDNYTWDFGDGEMGYGEMVAHTYAKAGTYAAILKVVDDDNGVGVDTLIVTVTGPTAGGTKAPLAMAGNDLATAPDTKVSFNGSGSTDEDGTIANYTWSFGDGSFGYGATVDHTYARPGVYAVVLTVTDDMGATGIDFAIVSVQAVQPPSVDLTPLQNDLSAIKNDTATLKTDVGKTAGSVDAVKKDTAALKKDAAEAKSATSAFQSMILVVLLVALVVAPVMHLVTRGRIGALRGDIEQLKPGGKKKAPMQKKASQPAPEDNEDE